jgi:hypothetical protein
MADKSRGPKKISMTIGGYSQRALGLASPADRAAYLEDVCGDNPRLRLELDALLAAHDRLGATHHPVARNFRGRWTSLSPNVPGP